MDGYLWLKALHVVAIVSWMVGMLYLPRLFVYHAGAPAGSEPAATFAVMERRLLKGIMLPAILVVWVSGLWLGVSGGWFKPEAHAYWLHAKVALVLAMSGVHGFYAASAKRFARGANTRSPGFWRVLNEVPTVLLIGIVILVIVKPF